MRAVVSLLLLLASAPGCGQKEPAIAKLVTADGPVDREPADGGWKPAAIGTGFFLGDAARTADGAARLAVASGGAQIAMQPHTILRFGGKAGGKQIAVELGTIDLTGTGSYALDIGDLRLSRNGTVRVTAKGNGASSVELTIGEAQVSTVGGDTVELVVGKVVDIGKIVVTSAVDAGVPDAPVVDAPDAPADPATVAEIEARGRVEVQRPGETGWKPLGGAKQLDKGTKLRVAGGGSAKLTALGTTLELAGGARVTVGDDLGLSIDAGGARVTGGKVQLPGGALALAATPSGPSEARLDVGARDSKVTMQRGGGKLTGAPGTALDMARGESAALARTGTIRVIEAIPTTFDFRITAGDRLTIHDPRPPTTVQLLFDGKCPEGGIIELDRDARFRTAKVSGGKDAANVRIDSGGWAYRLRCTAGAREGGAVASGQIVVVRDSGTRALPRIRPPNDIESDGRIWRVSYQSVIPDLRVQVKGTGRAFRLHVAQGGKEDVFDAGRPTVTIPGTRLKEGQYTYWVDIDGVKQDKVSTLIINFDQTAAQVYIEAPQNGAPWTGDIDVRGAVLPGWTAAIDTLTIPIDNQRRFAAKVSPPPGTALAIKLAHPQRGVHYYLRRAR